MRTLVINSKNIVIPLLLMVLAWLSILGNAPAPRVYYVLKKNNYVLNLDVKHISEKTVVTNDLIINGAVYYKMPDGKKDYNITNITAKIEYTTFSHSFFAPNEYDQELEEQACTGTASNFNVTLHPGSVPNIVNPSQIKIKFFGIYTNKKLKLEDQRVFCGERTVQYYNPGYRLSVTSPQNKKAVNGSFELKGSMWYINNDNEKKTDNIKDVYAVLLYWDNDYVRQLKKVEAVAKDKSEGGDSSFTIAVDDSPFKAIKEVAKHPRTGITIDVLFFGTIDGVEHSFSTGAPYKVMYRY